MLRAVWSIRSVTRSVEKMRATSAARASPSSGSTSVKVRPPEVDLRIKSWWSASAAIWAEWVTQMTWRWEPIFWSLRPIFWAALPLTPVSI